MVTVVTLTKREGKKCRVSRFALGGVAESAVRRAIAGLIIEHLGIAFDDAAGDDE